MSKLFEKFAVYAYRQLPPVGAESPAAALQRSAGWCANPSSKETNESLLFGAQSS